MRHKVAQFKKNKTKKIKNLTITNTWACSEYADAIY